MSWDYQKFTFHPVDTEQSETRGRNTIIQNYHCRLDTNIGKGFCAIFQIPCACPYYVAQLDKYWLPYCDS